eukprot:scaffold32644_cov99-Amphora_coffeaeformis.AAC.1
MVGQPAGIQRVRNKVAAAIGAIIKETERRWNRRPIPSRQVTVGFRLSVSVAVDGRWSVTHDGVVKFLPELLVEDSRIPIS